MVGNPCCLKMFSALTAVLVLCRVQPAYMTIYTAKTSPQVSSVFNSYSMPINETMEKRFLQEVVDSKIGLCLNLAPKEDVLVNTSMVALYVGRTVNISSETHRFPCVNCSSLISPAVEFSITDASVPNGNCLGLARFSRNIQAMGHNRTRLSDILYVSLSQNATFVNLSGSDAIHLKIPLTNAPNSPHILECLSLDTVAWEWQNSSCWTNQTIKIDNGISFVQCRCSNHGFFSLFANYGHHGSLPNDVTLRTRLSLTLDASCAQYLSNATVKADFLNTIKYTIAVALNTSVSNIINLEAECGSIIVNFTLISRDGTNTTLEQTIVMFGNLVTTDSFKVKVKTTTIYPYNLRSFGVTMPGLQTFISAYYKRKFSPVSTTKATEIQPLEMDYSPFIIAVAVILAVVICCVCVTCFSHSWSLHKKKYTEFNSDKAVPKSLEVVEEEEEEATPAEFPMTFSVRPKVNERTLTKYDWARTSYAHEETDVAAFVTTQPGPRLMMDCTEDGDSGIYQSSQGGSSVAIDVGRVSGLGSCDEIGEHDEFGNEEEGKGEPGQDGTEMDGRESENGRESQMRRDKINEEDNQDTGEQDDVEKDRPGEGGIDEDRQGDGGDWGVNQTEDGTQRGEQEAQQVEPEDGTVQEDGGEPVEPEDERKGSREEETREEETREEETREEETREEETREEETREEETREEETREEETREEETREEETREEETREEETREEETREEETNQGKAMQDDDGDEGTNTDPEGSPGTQSLAQGRVASARSGGTSSRLSLAMTSAQGMPEPSL